MVTLSSLWCSVNMNFYHRKRKWTQALKLALKVCSYQISHSVASQLNISPFPLRNTCASSETHKQVKKPVLRQVAILARTVPDGSTGAPEGPRAERKNRHDHSRSRARRSRDSARAAGRTRECHTRYVFLRSRLSEIMPKIFVTFGQVLIIWLLSGKSSKLNMIY